VKIVTNQIVDCGANDGLIWSLAVLGTDGRVTFERLLYGSRVRTLACGRFWPNVANQWYDWPTSYKLDDRFTEDSPLEHTIKLDK